MSKEKEKQLSDFGESKESSQFGKTRLKTGNS